ncbi:hypothetical protein G647_05809 [Cladophialophora carrionii CBS 160.54]|uniref:NCT transcriptional regulatory complex subunit A n=1 Tax=Cladophialophora carrionii CBS 160.54 TaxID=1279043 RepID=V9DDG2_9EURO|nr:uncharacterized protein G647_05809 [Cladophialophora carrionii CBS 160.54]ETI24002.1 hypothetical protein G647_05809 [Cladophialophora carrionii CBS 160.54]
MSEEHENPESSYRPSSPDLSGFTNATAPPPRLARIPSYNVPDPNFPPGYSFSPRGSYDASPFFSPSTATPSTSYFGSRPQPPSQFSQQSPYSPQTFRTPSLPGQIPVQHSPPLQSRALGQPTYNNPPPPQHQQPSSRSPFSQTLNQPYLPPFPAQVTQYGDMPRTRRQQAAEAQQDPDFHVDASPKHAVQPKAESAQPVQPPMPAAPADLTAGIDVRTKFPVARIKRIMQADEDVGKVAQATPTAVAKALELFMIALVTKGATEARANNSKRVTAQHLKAALMNDGQFDFLNEICENIPDESSKKGRAKSEAKSEDSDEEIKPKGKGKGGRKRKADTDDESD